jgi:hypothetical protein
VAVIFEISIKGERIVSERWLSPLHGTLSQQLICNEYFAGKGFKAGTLENKLTQREERCLAGGIVIE